MWEHRANQEAKRKRPCDRADEEEEKEDDEVQAGSNKRLLEHLTQQISSYDWQTSPHEKQSSTDFDRIHIPMPSEPIKYKKRGEQHLKGSGKVDVSLRHPRFYMPIIRRWFNRLRWKLRQEGPNTPSNTVTMLECVVDFELSMGHGIGTVKGEVLTWAQKARR